MGRWISAVLAGLVAAGLAWMGVDMLVDDRSPPATASSTDAPDDGGSPQVRDRWVTFEPPNGTFSVELPGQPTRTRSPVAGTELVMVSWLTEDAASAHGVTVFDLHGQPFDLHAAAEGSARELGGTVVTQDDTVVLGEPAVEYLVESRQEGRTVYSHGVVTVIDDRGYILIGVGADRRMPSFARVRDSFAVGS